MLIKCPECGGLVSDKAQACPHCGAPVSVGRRAEAHLSEEEIQTPPAQASPEAAHETESRPPASITQEGTPSPVTPGEYHTIDTAYGNLGPAPTLECEPSADVSGGGEAHHASGTDGPASTVSVLPDQAIQAGETSTLPYGSAGGFSILYGIFNGVISPAIAVGNVRSEIGSGPIAANPELWAELVRSIWGFALAMGFVFAGMGVAILRSRRAGTRKALIWCTILLTLGVWLVLAVRSTSLDQGAGVSGLGVPDIVFISALVGSLTLKKPRREPTYLAGSAKETATQAESDGDVVWQYRVDGHVGYSRISAGEIRRRIADGRLPRTAEVWTEGMDNWRRASDPAVFVGGREPAPEVAADNEPVWQYRVDGHVGFVPLPTEEISRRIADGSLPRSVEVWSEGADKWRPASDYAVFAGTGPGKRTG